MDWLLFLTLIFALFSWILSGFAGVFWILAIGEKEIGKPCPPDLRAGFYAMAFSGPIVFLVAILKAMTSTERG